MEAVQELAPTLFCFVHSAYSTPSTLFWSDKVLQSAERVQQGDPLGPLLFCLTIHNLVSQLESELCLFFLDDGTLGGSVETLRHDLEVIHKFGEAIGLELNKQKSEIICSDIGKSALLLLPGAQSVDPLKATLLIGDLSNISDILNTYYTRSYQPILVRHCLGGF